MVEDQYSENAALINQAVIPSSLLFDFFRSATAILTKGHELVDNEDDENLEKKSTTLERNRIFLLKVQRKCLEDTVSKYNETTTALNEVTTEQLEDELRRVGEIENTSSSEHSDEKEILDSMEAMNVVAKIALVRQILRHEWRRSLGGVDETEDYGAEGNVSIEEGLLNFCGVCATAVQLPEVRAFFSRGGSLYEGDDFFDEDDDDDSVRRPVNIDRRLRIYRRLERIQTLLFHAVGIDPKEASVEIQRRLLSTPDSSSESSSLPATEEGDEENTIIMALRQLTTTVESAMEGSLLSDLDEGGCTRVVSVVHTENDDKDVAATAIAMEERQVATEDGDQEDERRRALQMARAAAALRNQLLDRLRNMDADTRSRTLEKAQQSHLKFMQKVMSLPPGLERTRCLQNISAEDRESLAIYKLWEEERVRSQGGDYS